MADEQGSQYLTFLLNGEQYGVSILRVQEIRAWEAATRVPNTPAHMCGVVNLRGNIVPVYDLRRWFGLAALEYTRETVVIIVRTGSSADAKSMGLVVESVSDVLALQDEQIAPTPRFDQSVPTQYLQGLATLEHGMLLLLDLDALARSNSDEGEPEAASPRA